MNIKYVITEMGFEGKVPSNHPNMRVLEAQIYYLDLYHIPLVKVLQEDKSYDGDVMVVLPKGSLEKPINSFLMRNYPNTIQSLKTKFNKIYFYQDGETGWWNQTEVSSQVWWYNQISSCDEIFVPNETDLNFYKGILPNVPIKVIRSVMVSEFLDSTKFKHKEDRTIVTGPLTYEYNGFSQVLLAHQFGYPIDIPPMGESRMPKDSWEMANNIGVTYLKYMNWENWMYNLNKYKLGFMLSNATASGSFALNCAYLGIPCIGDRRADTQRLLFPELSVDSFDNYTASLLVSKLKDPIFYKEVVDKAKENYYLYFTKEQMLNILFQ